ncbi:MAG: hypothetical protein QM568_07625 [Microbacterium sp.]
MEQVEVGVDVSHAGSDVVRDRLQLGFEFFPLAGDVAELAAYARGVDAAVGCEVDEVVFLGGEAGELGFGLLLEHLLGADLVIDRGFHEGPDSSSELGSKRECLVVLLDGLFDAVDVGVRSVAGVVLYAAAEEVRVRRLRLAVDVHEDHAPVGVCFEAAAAAPDRPLQVVVVLASALAGVAAGVEELLDAVEELHVDEGFVASLVVLAFVAHLSEVVPVAEHLVDFRV